MILAALIAFGFGVAFNRLWLWHRVARVRYCESCHSDSTENHTAFVHLCTDCYRIYRADHIAATRR